MSDDDPVHAALAERLGDDAAAGLLRRLRGFSNHPNAVKGAAKLDAGPDVAAAALAVVENPALASPLGLAAEPLMWPAPELWPLLTLAARADVGVVDRVAPLFVGQAYADRLFRAIRRAAGTAPGPTAPGTAPETTQPDVPQKLSEVNRWVAAHPDVDPAVLGPRPGQRAAARVAAVRALGAIGTPAALAVLSDYAADRYPDALLAELHRAWDRFDRRVFAATMFRPGRVDLGVARSIEGIGAVPGLTGLTVVLEGGADLAPLAECTALRTLAVGAEGEPGLRGVEPVVDLPDLVELQLTRTTRHADLAPLARSGVRRLRIDLDGADADVLLAMPHLERVLVADDSPAPDTGAVLADLVRRGVQVTVYAHQAGGFPLLVESGASDLVVVEQSGYVGVTADPGTAGDLRSRLVSNVVP
ncbi:hypothetical protein [Klenkia marina]|uniref:hypothetical protein n=1 Tax=Klenkia marina TaxID=1960309 RepID=UPI00105A7D73|nr:hypothetical protein [Klenkia marina]